MVTKEKKLIELAEKRMQLLRDWLYFNKTRTLRVESLVNGDSIEWLSVNGRTLILHVYKDMNGWDIYAPVTDSNSIQHTLEALTERLK